MSEAIKTAFRRASRVSPLYHSFQLYRLAKGGPYNRPIKDTFDWMETARGTLHWRDVDGIGEDQHTEFREGVLTVLATFATAPHLVLTEDGNWLTVVAANGADALGVAYTLIVRRWNEDNALIIRNAAP